MCEKSSYICLFYSQNWYTHIQRFTTSFAMGITYGQRAVRTQSRDCAGFLEVQPQFISALELGTMPPVDLFPILTWVPERWAAWKRTVTYIRELHETLYGRLLKTVETRVQRDGEVAEPPWKLGIVVGRELDCSAVVLEGTLEIHDLA